MHAFRDAWPLCYGLLYVQSHLSKVTQSWFLDEKFNNWASFIKKFRETFVLHRRSNGPAAPPVERSENSDVGQA